MRIIFEGNITCLKHYTEKLKDIFEKIEERYSHLFTQLKHFQELSFRNCLSCVNHCEDLSCI